MTIKNLYPTQRPALDLNFARAKRLDPRVSLTRASVGTYVGNDGLIKYAAAGEARFDHDPVTGESLGLLVEESSTNLFDYSVDVSQWTGANWTATPNSITAPDGTLTGGKVVPIIGTTFQTIGRSITWTSGVTYSVSFFAKDAGMGGVQVQCFGQINRGAFDLVNGTSSIVTTGLSTSITPFPNGWYKCVYIFTAGSASTGNAGLRVPNGFTPDGVKGIYAWGFQVEALAFPTSYIPTTGSTVTRAADVASLTNTNVYDTDSFTILNNPYGAAGGGSTLNIVGGGQTPVKRTTVYNQDLSQSQINTLVKKDDEFWRWRILGSSFALPDFTTDGQVTVDWGDGTVETLTTSEHTFTDGGGYHDVGFRLDSGTYFRPHINDNASHDTKVVAVGPAPESMKLAAQRAFSGCSSLKVIDATIDTTVTTNFILAWANCSSLTSFPLIDTSNATSFYQTWFNCSSLTTFPANFFDSWTGTPSNGCFYLSWDGCSSLTATSVENILNSIDTSGQSAPASGVDIAIDYNASSGTPNISTAVTNLKSRGWTITLNGVAQ